MRYVSLFSGIEAASVAWEPLGWEPAAFCEVEAFPSAVLACRWPGVPNLGDVTQVDWEEFEDGRGAVDLVVGGSPFQSFSVAGGREGLDGESRLMYEYIRAVRDVRPRWFLWENVPGVFSTDAGRAFGILLHEMDELGYGVAWRVLDAQFFGVAQRRRRVFLVGRLGDGGASAAVLFERESVRGNTSTGKQKREELAARAGIGAQSTGGGRPAFCIQGDGSTNLNANGRGYSDDGGAFTLNCTDRHSVAYGLSETTLTPKVARGLQPTLLAGGQGGPTFGVAQPIGFVGEHGGNTGLGLLEGLSPTVSAKHAPSVCFAQNQRGEVRYVGGDGQLAGALPAQRFGTAKGEPLVSDGMIVRRLTPTECERLQGFPDGHTDVPYRGREHPPDTPRYRAIGNSMAVPVMRWIGERIQMVEDLKGGGGDGLMVAEREPEDMMSGIRPWVVDAFAHYGEVDADTLRVMLDFVKLDCGGRNAESLMRSLEELDSI